MCGGIGSVKLTVELLSLLLLASRAEAAVEGDVEGVQGGLPPVGPPLPAAAGGVQAHDRQVQALQGGLLGREVAAGVHRPPQPGINGFDRVCRADDRPYFPVEGKERDEFRPRVLPGVWLFWGDGGRGGLGYWVAWRPFYPCRCVLKGLLLVTFLVVSRPGRKEGARCKGTRLPARAECSRSPGSATRSWRSGWPARRPAGCSTESLRSSWTCG